MMIGKELTNPRTISETFRMTKNIGDVTDASNENLFRNVASSLLDEETVTNLMIFIEKDIGLVAEPEKILKGELVDGKTVEEYFKGLMTGEVRTDIIGILCDRLYGYIHMEKTVPDKKSVKNFQKFLTCEILPQDLRYGLVDRIIHSKEIKRLNPWVFGNLEINEMLKTLFQTH